MGWGIEMTYSISACISSCPGSSPGAHAASIASKFMGQGIRNLNTLTQLIIPLAPLSVVAPVHPPGCVYCLWVSGVRHQESCHIDTVNYSISAWISSCPGTSPRPRLSPRDLWGRVLIYCLIPLAPVSVVARARLPAPRLLPRDLWGRASGICRHKSSGTLCHLPEVPSFSRLGSAWCRPSELSVTHYRLPAAYLCSPETQSQVFEYVKIQRLLKNLSRSTITFLND